MRFSVGPTRGYRLTDEDARSLDDIGIRCNTDKASRYIRRDTGETVPGHDYLVRYAPLLAGLHKRGPFTVLDLGVGFEPDAFASALMWAEYFPQAEVVAVDICPHEPPSHPRVSFMQADLSRPSECLRVAARTAPALVVEDASHLWRDQLCSLVYFFPLVGEGGYYILEDLHTSGPAYRPQYSEQYEFSPLDLLQLLLSKVVLMGEQPVIDASRAYRAVTDQGASAERAVSGVFAPLLDALAEAVGAAFVLNRSVILQRRDEARA